jgi:hypothetical protein
MYVQTIPYLQFPLLLAGRPFTGERAMIPGVAYQPEEKDSLLREWRQIWKYYQEHPNGPYVYGPWDAFPPRPNLRQTHARWLKQYLPLVQEGTWAYIEIRDSDLFAHGLPANTVASVFTNLETYLVVANYDNREVTVHTTQPFAVASDLSGKPQKAWTIPSRSLRILRLETAEA